MIIILCITIILFLVIFLWCAVAASPQYDRDVSDEEQIFFIKNYHKKGAI